MYSVCAYSLMGVHRVLIFVLSAPCFTPWWFVFGHHIRSTRARCSFSLFSHSLLQFFTFRSYAVRIVLSTELSAFIYTRRDAVFGCGRVVVAVSLIFPSFFSKFYELTEYYSSRRRAAWPRVPSTTDVPLSWWRVTRGRGYSDFPLIFSFFPSHGRG